MYKAVLISISLLWYSGLGLAYSIIEKEPLQFPLYVGFTGGYGSTTWRGLVPSQENQNFAMTMSTPIATEEGGGTWGFIGGYEFAPYFAVEARYRRYPDAKIIFDSLSVFAFDNNGRISFNTHTETVEAIAKLMIFIPRTAVRVYSGVGIAGLHRWDEIKDEWRPTPTFSVGANYNLTEHLMFEVGGSYTAGNGESEVDPVQDYFPFLYAAFVSIAYRF